MNFFNIYTDNLKIYVDNNSYVYFSSRYIERIGEKNRT